MGCGCLVCLQPLEPEPPAKQFSFLHSVTKQNFECPLLVCNSKSCLLKDWNTEFGGCPDSCVYEEVGLHFKEENFQDLGRHITDLYNLCES